MEHSKYYQHVSSWIQSYYNPEALEWLKRFILNSQQPQEIKDRLLLEADRKVASLTNAPFFSKFDGMQLLMDDTLTDRQHPQIFTTRYSAMSKIAQLRLMGYDVRLVEGGAFFRIQQVQPEPIKTDNFLTPQTLG